MHIIYVVLLYSKVSLFPEMVCFVVHSIFRDPPLQNTNKTTAPTEKSQITSEKFSRGENFAVSRLKVKIREIKSPRKTILDPISAKLNQYIKGCGAGNTP